MYFKKYVVFVYFVAWFNKPFYDFTFVDTFTDIW
ncbi:hypothetical protein SM0020_34962 [Sinorhizobium meliloti CCNWSX0020]|uniref:Uncharacterized protein n=1 Tax=Sinorhizobium meliloti CCNWSX0020 TaxID=1107881 RepID=H0GBR7_RHIML|nr:hypothetical protein SM0020_34962 [Sinorhizobium meliloti CCNWSX0020]